MSVISFFRSQPAQSFETLLAPELDYLYRLAFRFTGSAADAEDLVQDLLIKLYPKATDLSQLQALRPWLTRALHNQYVDSLRKRQRTPLGWLRGASESDDVFLEGLAGDDPGPEQAAERQDLQAQLTAALGRLSPEHRVVVTLHDVEGHQLNEIAVMLEVPIGTLKSRLHRARAHLRDILRLEPFASGERERGKEALCAAITSES